MSESKSGRHRPLGIWVFGCLGICLLLCAQTPGPNNGAYLAANRTAIAAGGYTLKDSHESGGAGISLRSDTSECWSTTVKATASYTPSRISLSLQKVGSPTGNVTVYIYNTADAGSTEGPPDDVDVTAATVDASTLSTSLGWIDFDLTGAAAWTSGKYYQVVCIFDGGTGTDYVKWDATGFVDNDHGYYNRATAPPGATDDAANWAVNDANGSCLYRIYSTP